MLTECSSNTCSDGYTWRSMKAIRRRRSSYTQGEGWGRAEKVITSVVEGRTAHVTCHIM